MFAILSFYLGNIKRERTNSIYDVFKKKIKYLPDTK